MRYLIEPRDQRYVKAQECFSFCKNIGKNSSKKYGEKFH